MESLAWQAEQADRCPGCQGRLSETTHPDNDDAYEGHVLRCHRCKAQKQAMAEFVKQDNADGLYAYSTADPGVTTS